jgi:hypothetical protein
MTPQLLAVFFFLICLLTLAAARPPLDGGERSLAFTDCGSVGAEIASVTIDGCAAVPCEVQHGTVAHGQVAMKATAATQTLTCEIFGIIFGVQLPFPGGCQSTDACTDLTTGDCPVQSNENLVYDINMKILNSFPAVSVDGKWTLKDDNSNLFICFILPMKIKG